jgi:uncharacterized protein with von Willebrand factor type A (vWA) domain
LPTDYENESSTLTTHKKISDMLEGVLREMIAQPRNIPRSQRGEIAEILLRDVFDDGYNIKDPKQFSKKYGAFYPIFISIRSSEEWQRIKELSKRSEVGASILIRSVLAKVFTLIESFNWKSESNKNIGEDLKTLLEKFNELIEETLSLWGRKVNPDGDNNDQAGRELLDELKEFMENKSSTELLDEVLRDQVLDDMKQEIDKIEDSLDNLETLSLLMPGRLWDKSITDLHRIYLNNIDKYASIFRNIQDLQDLVDMIGRIDMEYGAKQVHISPLGKTEMHSVTLSSDINHLLPFELAKFLNPVMKRKFYADLIEGKLATYQLRGKYWSGGPPKKRKGPVVALIDTSGSMHGTPELVAKAIILAISKRMLKEGRNVRVILFASTNQTYTIDLTDKARMAEEFLNFLTMSFSGGNDSNTPLLEGMKALKDDRFKGADLLFITDGIWPSPDNSVINEWNILKKEKDARIFTLVIGNDNAGGLTPVSDFTYLMDRNARWGYSDSPVKLIKYLGKAT